MHIDGQLTHAATSSCQCQLCRGPKLSADVTMTVCGGGLGTPVVVESSGPDLPLQALMPRAASPCWNVMYTPCMSWRLRDRD